MVCYLNMTATSCRLSLPGIYYQQSFRTAFSGLSEHLMARVPWLGASVNRVLMGQ